MTPADQIAAAAVLFQQAQRVAREAGIPQRALYAATLDMAAHLAVQVDGPEAALRTLDEVRRRIVAGYYAPPRPERH